MSEESVEKARELLKLERRIARAEAQLASMRAFRVALLSALGAPGAETTG